MQRIRIYTAKSKSSIKNGEQIICRKDFFWMFQWKARMLDVLRGSYFKKYAIENYILHISITV